MLVLIWNSKPNRKSQFGIEGRGRRLGCGAYPYDSYFSGLSFSFHNSGGLQGLCFFSGELF